MPKKKEENPNTFVHDVLVQITIFIVIFMESISINQKRTGDVYFFHYSHEHQHDHMLHLSPFFPLFSTVGCAANKFYFILIFFSLRHDLLHFDSCAFILKESLIFLIETVLNLSKRISWNFSHFFQLWLSELSGSFLTFFFHTKKERNTLNTFEGNWLKIIIIFSKHKHLFLITNNNNNNGIKDVLSGHHTFLLNSW